MRFKYTKVLLQNMKLKLYVVIQNIKNLKMNIDKNIIFFFKRRFFSNGLKLCMKNIL